jgi:probable addiction module antidote protein
MKKQARIFDPAVYLDDDAAIAVYLSDALETGDAAFITDAIGVAARARGMSQIAKDSGLSRESLYRALSANGNPEFSTVLKVLSALGVKLSAGPISEII